MKTDVTLPGEQKVTKSSPFAKAEVSNRRLKLFLWGDSGAGKTTLALQFPNTAVIDLEGGTDLYGEAFNFDVLKATTADEVMDAVNWLLAGQHNYSTIVIDPITVYWDALQKKWSEIFLRRNKKSKGHRGEFYDIQAKDWMAIKAELKDLIRRLTALDMNVILTARQKPQYADGDFMRRIGDTFDGEKSLPYLFDSIVQIWRDGDKFMGRCHKDRSNLLPSGDFEVSYAVFEERFGNEALARTAESVLATSEQVERILELARGFGMSDEDIEGRLPTYGATSFEDLTKDTATTIITKLEETANAQSEQPEGDSGS